MSKYLLHNRTIVFILAVLLFANICIIPAQASSDDIIVYVDGHKLSFDDPPIIENGRTLVPLRSIFEAMGVPVDWDGSTSTVIVIKDNMELRLTIGSTSPTINGEPVPIDVPARIIKGRTYVPLRFVSNAFGNQVDWFSNSNTISINSNISDSSTIRHEHINVQIFNGCEDLAMLIQYSDENTEETTLITAGNCSDAADIVEKLEDNDVHSIDQFIVTTPFKENSDGITEIYENFRVKETIISDETSTSDAYEEYMQENYPDFPLKPDIPDISELIPDVSELIPDLSELIPDLSDLF